MPFTAEELRSIIKEEIGLGLDASAIERVLVEKFGTNIAPGQVTHVVDKATERTEHIRNSKNAFFSRMILDMCLIRDGKKPEHGTDFDDLERMREEYQKRTGVAVGASNSAGNFVPTELSSDWINLTFRDDGLLSKCRRRPMVTDSLLIPTLTGGITVYITPEATDTSSMASQATGQKPESQITTGQITLSRTYLTARALISRKTLRIAAVAEDALRADMPLAIRAFASKAITVGQSDSGGTINGLDTLVTTNAKTWNAAKPRRGLIQAINSPGIASGGVAQTNLLVGGPAAIMELACMEDAQGRLLFVQPGQLEPTEISGIPLQKDFNIPSTYGGGTDSRLYGGDFAQHANVGMEDAMFMQVNPYTYSKQNMVEILMELVFGWVPSNENLFFYLNVPTA